MPPIYTLEQFGGVPGSDCSAALVALLQAVNTRGGFCTIEISAGTWNYKHDETYSNEERWLIGCRHVDIRGAGKTATTMRVLDGALCRAFVLPNVLDKYSEGWGWIFEDCHAITLRDMTIDGNVAGLDITQEDTDGNCFGVDAFGIEGFIMENVRATAMGASGLRLLGLNGVPCRNVTVTNCDFDNARVNNMEINSLVNAVFRNCTFDSANQIIGKGLGAGVDLEPPDDGSVAEHIRFFDCSFTNNTNFGFLQNRESSMDKIVDLEFDSCTFSALTGWSIWLRSPDAIVRNSTIVGGANHLGCHFIDCAFTNDDTSEKLYCVLTVDDHAPRFDRCTFEALDNKLLLFTTGSTSGIKEFFECTFTCKNSLVAGNSAVAILRDRVFMRLCQFLLSGSGPSPAWRITLDTAVGLESTSLQENVYVLDTNV